MPVYTNDRNYHKRQNRRKERLGFLGISPNEKGMNVMLELLTVIPWKLYYGMEQKGHTYGNKLRCKFGIDIFTEHARLSIN